MRRTKHGTFNFAIRESSVRGKHGAVFLLGMRTFLAVSKQVKTALGLGVAVIAVLVITVPINNLIYQNFLKADAIAPGVDLSCPSPTLVLLQHWYRF